jgi:hypothetical protein
LLHYRDQFKGKVVFCNCDDPYESDFFKYFAMNFNHLGLRKLITTCYAGSPISGEQLPLLETAGLRDTQPPREPYQVVISEVADLNQDGAIDLADVEHLLRHDANVMTPLAGEGDPGDHERARTMLVDALDDYRQLGMPVYASMTQALLR